MYTLVWTASFSRAAEKFLARHRNLSKKFFDTLRDLERDPFQSRLEYHHLGGKLKDVQEISINDSYRITLTVVISDKEILLLDVGSHDEVYR